MAYLPQLNASQTSRILTEAFTGYDHNLRIADGAWYDETNLTSAFFPLFSPRAKRAVVHEVLDPQGLIKKDRLAWVDGAALYYDGAQVEGISLSTAAADRPKKLVSLGAYLCIFPDGVYVNTQDLSDCGSLGALYSRAETAITLQPCKIDGSEYDLSNVTVADTAPESPENGAFWIDTSGGTHVLKQYSAASAKWVDIPTVYIKLGAAGIGEEFREYDGVTISGLAYDGDAQISAQVEALNADNTIYAMGTDYIVILGMLDQAISYTGSLEVKRAIPVMDHICEQDNRLWGCHYGLQDGVAVNEIYACALGDPRVWNRFAGISTDSYAVSVGSDGPFTGIISHGGYVLAFKEDCVHKIYGTMPSNYQISTTSLRGVQAGSERSMQVVNEILYYKSRTDVVAYDGSLPTGVSDALGSEHYTSARAGSVGSKYYISMRDGSGAWHMFVYDTKLGIWHREDDSCAMMFARSGDDLLYIDEDQYCIMSALGKSGEMENMVRWEAVSGIMGYEYPDHKYLGRITMRLKMEEGSCCEIYLQYDSDGEWIKQGDLVGTGTGSFAVPVIPRRCDHFQIRLKGEGDVKIYSMARVLELGSDH